MAKGYKGPVLDKDLDKISFVGDAAESLGRRLIAPGLAVVFIALCAFVAATVFDFGSEAFIVVPAVAVGAYMALNIGANDVANNVGPAVGARAMTLFSALLLAAVFESAGALLAGNDVLGTISGDILPMDQVSDPDAFIAAMMAALFAAAVWINLATWIGAPVSTTHSVVGGVIGAGVAAAGLFSIDWSVVLGIATGWIVSPLIGGLIAAGFLGFINSFVIYREDKIEAARYWLPILLGMLAWAFTAYLMLKGLRQIVAVQVVIAMPVSFALGVCVWLLYRPIVARQSERLANKTQSLRELFSIPLICSAALLSFAHGANDVANAVGPLAAIVQVMDAQLDHIDLFQIFGAAQSAPFWVSAVGAFGISAGLLLFGSRLVRVVGHRITRLNPIRAFCVALSAAITVLFASALGLPVSSTHIVVGAIFGVGFFREWYRNRYILRSGDGIASRPLLRPLRNREEFRRRLLVRRTYLVSIVGAWVVTVPVSALIAAGFLQLLQFAVQH
jgi:PiT family inorganic phosphate transporter